MYTYASSNTCIFFSYGNPLKEEQCVIHRIYNKSTINLVMGECLRLFQGDKVRMHHVILTHRSWLGEEDTAHCPPQGLSHAHFFVYHSMRSVNAFILRWMWMAKPFLVIMYIPRVSEQTKPRDDTADPTISLSPAVNSCLARHGACIPLPLARCSLNTV